MSSGQGSIRDRIRDATISVDEGYSDLFPAIRRATVKRHGVGSRLMHWSLFLLVTIMTVTGLMMWSGWYGPIDNQVWGGYYQAFGLHIWAAILVLPVGFVLFPFYHVVVDKHSPVPSMEDLRELKDVRELLAIGGALVGLRKYIAMYHDARRAYDEEEGHWVTTHPMQMAFFWIQIGLLVLVVVTGFGLYNYITVRVPAWVQWLGFINGWASYELLKQVHYFLTFAWIGAVAFHAYFPLIPGNWDFLKTMFTGKLENAYIISSNPDREED